MFAVPALHGQIAPETEVSDKPGCGNKRGLAQILVIIKQRIVNHRNHFAVVIMAAGRAYVMRTRQFTAIGTFVRVGSNQCVMGTPIVTAGFGNFILLDSHVSTFAFLGAVARFSKGRGPVIKGR